MIKLQTEDVRNDLENVERETEFIFKDFMYRRLVSRNSFDENDIMVVAVTSLWMAGC